MALSDRLGILASPFTVIERRGEEQDIVAIIDIIDRNDVGMVIAGLPRSMDGNIGQQAEKVQAFIELLKKQTEVLIEFRDERLTTVAARRLIREARSGRKTKIRSRDDAIAAALILQGYLDETLNSKQLP